MKKIVIGTSLFTLLISTAPSTFSDVPCAKFLKATQYARVIIKSKKTTFLVKRDFHHGISNEMFYFPDGNKMKNQSRVMSGSDSCGAYGKDIMGVYKAYDTYRITTIPGGYKASVIYINNVKETLYVYPLTAAQLKAEMQKQKLMKSKK